MKAPWFVPYFLNGYPWMLAMDFMRKSGWGLRTWGICIPTSVNTGFILTWAQRYPTPTDSAVPAPEEKQG